MSGPPFAGLNLARNLGDDPDAVEENHLRLAVEVGYPVERLYEVSQVHGSELATVDEGVRPELFRAREADAILGVTPGQAVGIRVADCVPILVADPDTRAVLAIHAGWRGVVAEVVPKAIMLTVQRTGARAHDLLEAIGPHIGPNAFEVGDEVAHALAQAIPEDPAVVIPGEPRPHVDLWRAVRAQLARVGLSAAHVESVGGCTYSDAHRFFSFRRDGKDAGRHLAAIVAGC